MNRNNNGFQLATLDLPQNQLQALPGADLGRSAAALNQSASTFDALSAQAKRIADAEAAQRGANDGGQAQLDGQPLAVDSGSAYGQAYLGAERDVLTAQVETNLRASIEALNVDFDPNDGDGFEKAASERVAAIMAPLRQRVAGEDARVWQPVLTHFNSLSAGLVRDGANSRRAQAAQAARQQDIAAITLRADQRTNDMLAAQRNAVQARAAYNVANPANGPDGETLILPEEQALIDAQEAAMSALVAMGPKTAFTLNGTQYEADNTRQAMLGVAQLEQRLNAGRTARLLVSETVAQEAAGDGRAQDTYAEQFAQRWRNRDPAYAGYNDADLADIQAALDRRAAQRLTDDDAQARINEQEVRQLTTKVMAGGRLSADEIARGNEIVSSLGDEGLTQQWDNTQTISRTGVRDLADGALMSVNGGHIPMARLPRMSDGRASGGGGRHQGGGHGGRAISYDAMPVAGGGRFFAGLNQHSGATSDPISFAHRQGMSVPQLNLRALISSNAQDVSAAGNQLRTRATWGASFGENAGVPQRVFSNAERAWFRDVLQNDPERAVAVAARVRFALRNDAPRALRELGLSGAAGRAADLRAQGANERLAQDLVNGSRLNTELPAATRQQNDAMLQSMRGWFSNMPDMAGQLNEMHDAVVATQRGAMARGETPRSTASLWQSMFGGVNRGGVEYGGFTPYNRHIAVVPQWLRRDRFDEFMGYAAGYVANEPVRQRPIFSDGRPATAEEISRMRLLPAGEGQYYLWNGRNNSAGQPQLLFSPTGGPYVMDTQYMRRHYSRRNPRWVAP